MAIQGHVFLSQWKGDEAPWTRLPMLRLAAPTSEGPTLIMRVITSEIVQAICPRCVPINVTDRQTDGRTTYDSNTAVALRASSGKNVKIGDRVHLQ